MPQTHNDEQDPLDSLAEEFMARRRAGEPVTTEQYAQSYPDLAAEIRDFFPTIEALEGLKHEPIASGGVANLGGARPEQLGEFKIIQEIGRGGMGVVFEAEQLSLDRRVALKVLPKTAMLDEKAKRRFTREARVIARLEHPHIVPIFTYGEDQGYTFFVMRLIRGVGWDKLIQELSSRSHPSPEALYAPVRSLGAKPEPTIPRAWLGNEYTQTIAQLGAQIAHALGYAHRMGAIHRDIKPSNCLLDQDGSAWLTDFGLATMQNFDTISATGNLAGTLRYMAPEQFEGQGDARADIYGLGITLYEMLALQPAFASHSRSGLIKRIISHSPDWDILIKNHVPDSMIATLQRAITHNPGNRFENADDFAECLQAIATNAPLPPSVNPPPSPPLAEPPSPVARIEEAANTASPAANYLWLLVCACVLAAAILLWLRLRTTPTTPNGMSRESLPTVPAPLEEMPTMSPNEGGQGEENGATDISPRPLPAPPRRPGPPNPFAPPAQ